MLVLTRLTGQQIVIDDRVVLTILDCGDGMVRLGFAAPRDVPIVRGEIQSEFHAGEEAPAGKTPPKG